MHATIRLLASEAATASTGPLRRAPFALLPPIPLYRRLLRAHRKYLPLQERTLGDAYVKSEWKLHRKIENPMHIIGFLTEWQLYAQMLEGDAWKGQKMDKAKIDKLSDQQIGQMYELMKATQGHVDDESEEAALTGKDPGDKKD